MDSADIMGIRLSLLTIPTTIPLELAEKIGSLLNEYETDTARLKKILDHGADLQVQLRDKEFEIDRLTKVVQNHEQGWNRTSNQLEGSLQKQEALQKEVVEKSREIDYLLKFIKARESVMKAVDSSIGVYHGPGGNYPPVPLTYDGKTQTVIYRTPFGNITVPENATVEIGNYGIWIFKIYKSNPWTMHL